MGVYARPDSLYWWLYLETSRRREPTKFLVGTTAALRRDSKRLAEDLYHQRMNELAARLYKLPSAQPAIRFDKYAKSYEGVIAQHKGAEREREMLKTLRAFFDDDLLDAIDPDRARAFMAHRAKKVQPATFNREVDLLKAMLRDAVPKYLSASPIVGLKRVRPVKPKRRLMTATEEAKLLAAATPLEQALLILGIDGLVRMNDILDVRAGDRHRGWLYIQDPKSGEPYEIVLSKRAAAALDALPPAEPGDYLFQQYRGAATARDRRSRVRRVLKKLCKRVDVPYGKKKGGLTFHWATRKTGATRMIVEHGKSIPAVQRQGNWKTSDVLLSIYSEADRTAQKDVVRFTSPSLKKRATPKTLSK
jgi:hypothetical protein